MTKTHWFTSSNATEEQRKFYTTRTNINSRCYNKNNLEYCNYWWRWIICEWDTFEEFKNDMRQWFLIHSKMHWLSNTTIDRVNVNWNYNIENCRRATREEQSKNRQKDFFAIVDWKKVKAIELQKQLWIWTSAAFSRIRKYNQWLMSKERLFSKGKLFQERKKFDINWEMYDVWRLMWECDITLSAAEHRLRDYSKWKIDKKKLFRHWNVRYRKKRLNNLSKKE